MIEKINGLVVLLCLFVRFIPGHLVAVLFFFLIFLFVYSSFLPTFPKDAELLPIMEEEDPRDQMSASSSVVELGSTMTDDAAPVPALNEERALVLYKPVDAQLLLSPGQSNVSFRVSSDLIHGLKNQAFQSGNQMPIEHKSVVSNNCLAVIPWLPNQGPAAATGFGEPKLYSGLSQEPMEAGEVESTSMEVEGDREQAAVDGVGVEGFHQWQQHCMTPHLPANSSTPIMWPW
ncbi:uncharacterized protein LOC103713123 isoform X1 [Phoenix dactylifera]|uniref:Uncharacterized protein LOC103713123 isoform X1 n=1 Tax=Phoenix dactylifera TaxID=42345 RepID=A0A8B7MV81_PHODC|nr:uncharacterized protein LOC103713123 isoform X1 [Phoenix dactylifera]